MVEPTGHCPYLGLKQNRAIRFASPTPEHRCYISGEPLEIPVDQSSHCLSQGHIHCPLYMGLTVPTTGEPTATLASGTAGAAAAGVRGWYGTLSPRDRAIYAIMLAMLAIIVAIYLFVGLQSLFARGGGDIGNTPTSVPATAAPAGAATAAGAGGAPEQPTNVPPTPTDLPTNPPASAPTAEPTGAPLILLPTQQVTQPPTDTPTSTTAPSSTPTTPTTPVASSTPVAPTATPRATSRPAPTSQPAAPAPTQPPVPTPAPPAALSRQMLTLYFADTTGALLVSVRRSADVQANRVAEAAVRELITGPRNGLNRLVPADAKLLGIAIRSGVATVNFDRDPGGQGGYDSIVFTLTELPTIGQVQIQVDGRNAGGARGRPVINPINPEGLPDDKNVTEYLPLYFPSVDGVHDVRLIRMVHKTKQTAEGTVRALLDGPGQYAGAVIEVIPAGTELRGIQMNKDVVLVDFTQPFAGAPDSAIRTIVESLTTLRTVRGVQFLVEGQPYLAGRVFTRPAINPE